MEESQGQMERSALARSSEGVLPKSVVVTGSWELQAGSGAGLSSVPPGGAVVRAGPGVAGRRSLGGA